MASDGSDGPETRVTVATLRGEVMTELAKITGAVDNLATEVRMDRETRARSDAEHDRIHADQSREISVLHLDVQSLKDWRMVTTATDAASPRLTWAAFMRDTKSAVLAVLAIVGTLYGIFGR